MPTDLFWQARPTPRPFRHSAWQAGERSRDRLHMRCHPPPDSSKPESFAGRLAPHRKPRQIRGKPENASAVSFRKEVIQPQVPLRLPCYDLVPIAEFILGA